MDSQKKLKGLRQVDIHEAKSWCFEQKTNVLIEKEWESRAKK